MAWTWLENKMFETFLVQFPEETPNRWEIIAKRLLKPVAEVKEHYELLVLDLLAIECDHDDVHVPDYKDECESSKQGSLRSKHGETKRKRGDKWTVEEHKLLLKGLKIHGKGDWRAISRNLIKTRTPQQVASHAQKLFLRLDKNEKKRSSIHDITLDEAETETNMDMAEQNESPVQEQP